MRMIPTIGFMIGCYIIARAVEIFFKDYKWLAPKIIMSIVAVLLIIVTIMNISDLFSAAQSSSRSLNDIPHF
jgi:hypothetical protein